MLRLLKRLLAIAVALGVGWVVYMIGFMTMPYEGALALVVQPFLAAICSTVFVGLALVLGLVLKLPPLRGSWTGTRAWAALLVIASIALMLFGRRLGLTDIGTDPETGATFVMLHPAAALAAYFTLLFALANWPFPPRARRDDRRL